jgi:hypothetical protein
MTAAVQAVLEQAKRLSEDERAELLAELHRLDAGRLGEAELWAAWRPELDRRRALLERGELEMSDAREAIADLRARLRPGAK